MEWSINGIIDGMRCVQLWEPETPEYDSIYLCVPESSPLRFSWSHDGPLENTECMRWTTRKFHQFWNNNYLCKDACTVGKVEILDSVQFTREYDGVDIIGLNREASCVGSASKELTLESGNSVEETVGVEFSKSSEVNWGRTISIEFGVNTPLVETSVTVTQEVGGSSSWGSSEHQSFSEINSKSATHKVEYKSPGGALVLGWIERYKIKQTSVPIKMHYQCPSGEKYFETSTMDFHASTYQPVSFKSMTGYFYRSACEDDRTVTNCVYELDWYLGHHSSTIEEVELAFMKCFENDKGYIFEQTEP